MFIVLLRKHTHHIALAMTMLVGLVAAITWQMLGYNELIFEGLPGFLSAILIHELFMVICFSQTGFSLSKLD